MTTPSEYAKNATAALHHVLHISPDDFDAEETAAVIEQAIRNATRERESRARRQLKEVQAAAQERLARLLSSSPAVIYSFKATGDFAPTFVSDNISDVFGYAPGEYLGGPVLLARPGPPRRPRPRRGRDIPILPERGPHGGVSLSPQGRLLLLGERRAAPDPRRRRRAVGDRRLMERHHGAQGGRGGEGCGARPSVPAARQLAGGDLQLSRRRAISRRPSSARTSRTGWATSRGNTWNSPDFWRRCVHPDDLAAVEAESVQLFQKGRHTVEYRFLKKDGTYCWVNDEQRLIRDAGRPAGRGGRLVERHHRAQASGGSRGGGPGARRAPARQLAGGDLQLQGDRRLRADLHQPEHQGPARLRPRGIPREPGFLAQPRPSRGQPAHPQRLCAPVRGGAPQQRVPLPQEGRQLLLGQRRAAPAPRRGGRAGRGGRRVERHHRAQAARRGPGRRAGPSRAPVVVCAGGDLQLQGDGRFRADLRQPEHQGLAGLRAAGIPGEPGFLAALRAPRRPRRGGGRVGPAVQERAATRSSTGFSRRTAATAG